MPQPHKAIFYRDWANDHIPEILEEIYLHKIYEPFLLGKHDLTIVDIGANQLLTSMYFSKYAKQIYAVEPAVEHQETIKKTLAFNELTNITLCPYALSNKNGTTKFYHSPNNTAHNLNIPFKADDYEEVETVTFDEFMKRNKIEHIDLLKLDPEGAESEIITSQGFIDNADKIDVIVGEHHYWDKTEIPQFTNILKDLGFEVTWLPNIKAQVYTAIRL